MFRCAMDRRNDPDPPPPPPPPATPPDRRPWAMGSGRRQSGRPWGPAPDPRWNAPARQAEAPAAHGATFATPFAWAAGSLLLTGTTFLVSVIALVRAFGALFD